jgi:hypothetical protein
MKNIKQQFKKIKFPLLGEYSRLVSPGKSIKVKMFYDVKFFDSDSVLVWIENDFGTQNLKSIFNYDELSTLLRSMQHCACCTITAGYWHRSAFYVDSELTLQNVDNTWTITDCKIL